MRVSTFLLSTFICGCGGDGNWQAFPDSVKGAEVWLTDANEDLVQDTARVAFAAASSASPIIDVDDSKRYQRVEGFGASLTESSVFVLDQLPGGERQRALEQIFDEHRGIGISVLRQPLGASDENVGRYSYDDTRDDFSLASFSIAHDDAAIIPMLHDVLRIHPDIFFVATAWSPPGWMKTNDSMLNGGDSGKLRGDCYDVYARYLVRAVKAYGARGIHIRALTPANEPGQSTDYPGMDLSDSAEADLIAKFLHPEIVNAGIEHELMLLGYDYNWPRRPVDNSFPGNLLADGRVHPAVAGIAFHCYGGDPRTMSDLHDKYPDKDMFVTECTSAEQVSAHGHTIEQLIRSMRNWARTYVGWNVALGPGGQPHEGHGCDNCIGLVTVDNGAFKKTRDYSEIGHASKFVKRGALRIDSTSLYDFRNPHDPSEHGGLENVAFLNPDGSHVVVAYNSADNPITFQIRWRGRAVRHTLRGHSAATYRW